MREHWGQWRACKDALDRSHRRSIVTYMADKPPDRPDYRGAFARIKVDLRGLYLAAFQSCLWNRMLARFLQAETPAGQLIDVPLKLGPVPFLNGLDHDTAARFQNTQLPLPSARLHLDPLKPEEEPMLTLITAVLAEFGLELRQLRVKYPRDSFFSKGHRAVSVAVGNLVADPSDDDLYPGRKKLALRFDLPRGSYATILVKRLTESGMRSSPIDRDVIGGSGTL